MMIVICTVMSAFARSQVTSGGLLLPTSAQLRTAGVFVVYIPVHTSLIHHIRCVHGSSKTSAIADSFRLVDL